MEWEDSIVGGVRIHTSVCLQQIFGICCVIAGASLSRASQMEDHVYIHVRILCDVKLAELSDLALRLLEANKGM